MFTARTSPSDYVPLKANYLLAKHTKLKAAFKIIAPEFRRLLSNGCAVCLAGKDPQVFQVRLTT